MVFSIKKLNIADWITISRLLACPVLLYLIFTEQRDFFKWLVVAAFLTDALDGYIARSLKIASVRGARLDSAADASLFLVAMFAALKFELAFFTEHLMPIIIAFGFYMVQLIFAYIRYRKSSSFHTYLAKTAAVVQGTFFVALFFIGPLEWLFYLTLFFSIIETVEEILLISILPKWKANVKGIYWIALKTKQHENTKND